MQKLLVVAILAILLLGAGGSESAPARCIVVMDGPTHAAAQAELSAWLMVLQDKPIDDARMHIIRTSETLQALANTQTFGCEVTQ